MSSASTASDSSHDDGDGEDRHLQSCFVLRRFSTTKSGAEMASSSKTKRKMMQSDEENTASSPDLPPYFKEEHPLYGKWRMESFVSVWTEIESITKDVLVEQNTHTFEEIHRWIFNSFSADQQSKLHQSVESKSTSGKPCYPIIKKLATALVFIRNVEFVDDQGTFKGLGAYLKSRHCHVAILTPQEFSSKSGIGGCVRSMLKQTVKISPDTPDMDILVSWHHEPTRRKHPIAIIIEDVERCNCSALAEFIIMLSEWVVQIPIVLVMGMATTVDSLRKLLPSRAIQHLQFQRFNLKYPLERLEDVVLAVLIESFFGFDIGYKVVKFLYNFFLRQDGTVTSFLSALKILCIEHFSGEPLSFLCKELSQNAIQEDWEDICKALPEIMLKYAANLPSVKAHIKCEGEEIGAKLAAALLEIKKTKQNSNTVLMCLYEVGKYAKIHLMDIYCESLFQQSSSDLSNSGQEKENGKFIRLVIRKLRDLSLPHLARILQQWGSLTKGMSELNSKIITLLSIVEHEINGEMIECNSSGIRGTYGVRNKLSNWGQGNAFSDSVATTSEDNNGDSTCFTQTAKGNGEKQLPRSSTHGCSTTFKGDPKGANEMAMNILEQMVRQYLVPIESMPFHEIICYNRVDALQLALMGDTRRTIQHDLYNSQSSLQCSCCKGVGLSSSMHETSLAYHLAQEHGDVINVHDWYQAFGTIVSNSDLNSEHSETQAPQKKHRLFKEVSQADKASIQARFTKAITELQIVGLLRMPSKRRPDYIQRVAFGS